MKRLKLLTEHKGVQTFNYDEASIVLEEIERLSNIINELEKMMKNDLECACSMNENGLFNGAIDILEVYLDKLQELKKESE